MGHCLFVAFTAKTMYNGKSPKRGRSMLSQAMGSRPLHPTLSEATTQQLTGPCVRQSI